MLKLFSILSVFCWFCFDTVTAKADSFLLTAQVEQEQILPLIYVKDLEYYNHKKTTAYTKSIKDKLSLDPQFVITEDEISADFYILPKLVQSEMEPLNQDILRYSMSVKVELWSKGGILIDSTQQNHYIVIDKEDDAQKIAKDLLSKLLDGAIIELIYKIKNNQVFNS